MNIIAAAAPSTVYVCRDWGVFGGEEMSAWQTGKWLQRHVADGRRDRPPKCTSFTLALRLRLLYESVMDRALRSCRGSYFLMDRWPLPDESPKRWPFLRPAARGMTLPQRERHDP